MKHIIFDLDLTLVDTSCLEVFRKKRNWEEAYKNIPNTNLYPGISDIFDIIRSNNIKMVIVSTSPRTYIEKIVNHYNIPAKYIIGYHDAKPIKPHPAPMIKALELIGEPTSNVITFGDRVIDILASNAAGIKSVACFWGTKEYNELENSNYDYAIFNPIDIKNLII
jgi:phosphoglycolate phosphatase-like HAD superfamily hydrolase